MGKFSIWASLSLVAALTTLPASKAKAQQCTTFGEEDYTTLNGVENGGQSLRTVGPDMADAILTPDCRTLLVEVNLQVKLERRDLGSFDVFYAPINKKGQPYYVHVFATVSDSTLTRDFKRIVVQPRGATVLLPSTRYYIGIRKHVGALSTVILGNTVDPTVLSRPNVMSGAYFCNFQGQHPNAAGPYEMHVLLR